MKKTLALLLLAAAPAFASDEDVRKGLQNLQTLQQLAQLAEGVLMSGVKPPEETLPKDPWGTPYRFTVADGKYTIASAGSDRKFDETVWARNEQFTGMEGDVVLVDAHMVRSNRNWLYAQVTDATRDALDTLVRAEVHLMMARNPTMLALEGRRATTYLIQTYGAELARDAWGTPVRVIRDGEKVRVVSAGADKVFDEASWSKPPVADVNEDIVFDDGIPTRIIDDQAVLRAAQPKAEPIPQPLNPPLTLGWPQVGDGVQPPVALSRAEPEYPPIYRRAGITGLVILEAAISEMGAIRDARIIKSLAPGIDTAALEAVRKWTFQPATKDGQPVPVIFNLTMSFKLRD